MDGRIGLENNNLKCVAHSEIDNITNKTYRLLFGEEEINFGDLMKIDTNSLPDFDILIGGFPCQTFSIVGKRAGFEDNRGLVIYGLIKILKEKNISAFILENVKGLTNHDGGRTLSTIVNLLKDLEYEVNYKVLDSQDYGVPQMRERIYIVGIKKDLKKYEFVWPSKQLLPDIKEYLCDLDAKILDLNDPTFNKYLNNKYNNGKWDIKDVLLKDYLVLDCRQSDLRLYERKSSYIKDRKTWNFICKKW